MLQKLQKGVCMKRQWIEGYEGKYEILDTGKVLSYKKNGNIHDIGRQNSDGYMIVTLSDLDNNRVTRTIHRLIAEAFLPKVEGKDIVDHIDEDKTNNAVSNLRWCSPQENIGFYNTKEGRRHHIQLGKKRKEQLLTVQNNLIVEKKKFNEYVKSSNKELDEARKSIVKLQEELNDYKTRLSSKEDSLRKLEARIANSKENYTGFKDTTGMKFETVQAMVDATGKSIVVSGQKFNSCGAAASWIVEQEALCGVVRNKDTISKELRKYLQGRKSEWLMYEKYGIGY